MRRRKKLYDALTDRSQYTGMVRFRLWPTELDGGGPAGSFAVNDVDRTVDPSRLVVI